MFGELTTDQPGPEFDASPGFRGELGGDFGETVRCVVFRFLRLPCGVPATLKTPSETEPTTRINAATARGLKTRDLRGIFFTILLLPQGYCLRQQVLAVTTNSVCRTWSYYWFRKGFRGFDFGADEAGFAVDDDELNTEPDLDFTSETSTASMKPSTFRSSRKFD